MIDKPSAGQSRPLTGWHVLAMFVVGFGVIIGVNLTLAFKAVSTFPGLETKNSYVASQKFDVERSAQVALGWQVSAALEDDGLHLRILDAAGQPVQPTSVGGILGRATHTGQDQMPKFAWTGREFVAPMHLEPGYWNLRLTAVAQDGTPFRQRVQIRVSE